MKSILGYAELQERKRTAFSFGMTLGLYALVLGLSLLYGAIHPQEQVFSNMTVLVNLPGPISVEPGLGSIEASDLGEVSPTPQPQPAKTEAPKPAPAKEAPAKTAAAKTEVPAAKPETPPPAKPQDKAYLPSQEPLVQAPAAKEASAKEAAPTTATTVAEPWTPGERGPGSRQESASSSVYVPGQGLVPWTGGVTIHKAEKGSASDTYLGGAQGTVGHNIYVPIYYSLPLPRTVPAAVVNAIPDQKTDFGTIMWTAQERKKEFAKFYDFDGSSYRLKADVRLEFREPLWLILEDAGYNPADADYRQAKTLNPVVIGFTVTRDRQLKGADILQSSGDPEIDKALLYGFKRASFYNKTGETVPGRFIYKF